MTSSFSIPQNSISCFIGRVDELDEHFAENGIMWVDFDDINGENDDRKKRDESGTRIKKVIASWTLRSAYAAWLVPPVIKYRGKMFLEGAVEFTTADIEVQSADIDISNADISLMNLTISGGPPLQGPCATPVGPGTATIPVAISAATGSGKCTISKNGLGTVANSGKVTFKAGKYDSKGASSGSVTDVIARLRTKDDKSYDIILTAEAKSVSPWNTPTTDVTKDSDPSSNESKDDKQIKRDFFIMDRVIAGVKANECDKVMCMAFGNSMDNLYAVDIFV